jgi:hypothetical protein
MRSVQTAMVAVKNTATANFRLLRSNSLDTGCGLARSAGAYGRYRGGALC